MSAAGPEIHIFTGPVDAGKTGKLKEYLRSSLARGLSVAGVLSEALMRDGRKEAYMAVDIKDGERFLLVSREKLDSEEATGSFHFSDEGFRRASEVILRGVGSDMLVIDELGPQELKGKGFGPVLREVLRKYAGTLVLVIRRPLLDELMTFYGLKDRVVEITDCSLSEPVSFEPWS
ncbi:MAG: DUF2478 domain-containing protein [Spirochaetales bacterium]|nr:DUF2478 domain-containing protein [Spirochaetales bacterium]